MASVLSHRKATIATVIGFALVPLFVGCSDGAKPVTVNGGGNIASANATAGTMKLAVFSPQAPDPTPTREFTAPLGADIVLSLKIDGVDPKNASVGYQSEKLSGITVTTTTLNIRRPAEGDYKITLYLRDMAKCKAAKNDVTFCDLKGRAMRTDRQPFDAVESILLSVIDPASLGGDPSKNCVGGSGMFDDIMCKRGLVGTLVNVLMPGGIGGMMGSLGGGAGTGMATGTNTGGLPAGANTQPAIAP